MSQWVSLGLRQDGGWAVTSGCNACDSRGTQTQPTSSPPSPRGVPGHLRHAWVGTPHRGGARVLGSQHGGAVPKLGPHQHRAEIGGEVQCSSQRRREAKLWSGRVALCCTDTAAARCPRVDAAPPRAANLVPASERDLVRDATSRCRSRLGRLLTDAGPADFAPHVF